MTMDYFKKDGDEYVKVDEALHTQADLDKVVKDRAERIAKQQYSDYDELKETATKAKSTIDELNTKLTEKDTLVSELNGKVKTAQLGTEKVKIVNEFKLSDDLAEFVTGDDADEMRKRAEKLAKGIKPGAITVTKDGKPEPKAGDNKKIAGNLFGRRSDD